MRFGRLGEWFLEITLHVTFALSQAAVSTPFGYLLDSGVLKSYSFDISGATVLLERDTTFDVPYTNSLIGGNGL